MGSIKENRYRYSIDILVKVLTLRYPSENHHHELHIHKLVAYFDVFRLSNYEFFRFRLHLPRFCQFSVISLNCFWHFWSLFQWQWYRNYFAPLSHLLKSGNLRSNSSTEISWSSKSIFNTTMVAWAVCVFCAILLEEAITPMNCQKNNELFNNV